MINSNIYCINMFKVYIKIIYILIWKYYFFNSTFLKNYQIFYMHLSHGCIYYH